MEATIPTANGQYATKLDALNAAVEAAEREVDAARKADRKAGTRLEQASAEHRIAAADKASTAARLKAARRALEKAEDAKADEQGKVA